MRLRELTRIPRGLHETCDIPNVPDTSKLLGKCWFHFLQQVIFCLVLETVVGTH